MYPPIFPPVAANAACVALLKTGSNPIRFYLFGRAPQNVAYPYAVWRQVGGSPENYLGQTPDIDSFVTQVDVFANPSQGAAKAREVAQALRDAIEPVAYITGWYGDDIDPDTNNFRFTFQADWLTQR